jgi:antirestriction protein ArdC
MPYHYESEQKMNVYDVVTDRILAQLEQGIIPWRKEWKASGHSALPSNYNTKKPYRGINVWLLLSSPYADQRWLTYKQAQAAGGQVRRGEKGTQIFWSTFEKTEKVNGESVEKDIPFARTYTVFNVAQCDGLPVEAPADPGAAFEPIPAAQSLVDSYLTRANIELRRGGDRAFYNPRLDHIQMPLETAFDSPDAFYSTLFHECGHSTGHESRLDRKLTGGVTFGDSDYSKEELIAEFSSAFLCAETGISNERVCTNHVAYIQGWMRSLKNDKTLLVSAAQKAQRAADLIIDRAAGAAAESESVAA